LAVSAVTTNHYRLSAISVSRILLSCDAQNTDPHARQKNDLISDIIWVVVVWYYEMGFYKRST